MAIDLNKQTEEIYAAFNAHDLDRYLSLHTEDVFFEQVIADGAGGHGKEELHTFVKGFFDAFPDFKCEVTSFFASGNRQCEEMTITGTHRGTYLTIEPTGKSISLRGVLIRELRKGKTSRFSIYFDPTTLMRQLGVLPPTPQK
jgi:steroid delta-isomerase-like uncharacterized protein